MSQSKTAHLRLLPRPKQFVRKVLKKTKNKNKIRILKRHIIPLEKDVVFSGIIYITFTLYILIHFTNPKTPFQGYQICLGHLWLILCQVSLQTRDLSQLTRVFTK